MLMFVVFSGLQVSRGSEPESSTTGSVDFENDLIPVFTKLGCNSGACHGAAVGRGGFKLSLYGGDPTTDYEYIVEHLEGRRVNLANPEQSLIYLKPSESLAHEGGLLIEEGQESSRLLLDWIRSGAPQESRRKLQRVEVSPKRRIVVSSEERISLRATAIYSDGFQRDVTQWTVFAAEDDSAVSIGSADSKGPDETQVYAQVNRSGRHIIVARYLTEVVPVELLFPWDARTDMASQATNASGSMIDREVNEVLHVLGIPASGPVSDEGFVRRATLDLTGRLPDASLLARDGFQREQYVDELLGSEEFVEFWSLQLAKILRVSPGIARDPKLGANSSNRYHLWIAEQLREQVPYDQMARQLILATGDTRTIGPANFYRTVQNPREQAELFSEIFMGSRLRCANCHNHPLDRWTQDDYHGLAAIFAKVQLGDMVRPKPEGEVTHPRTLEPAIPKIPGAPLDYKTSAGDMSVNQDVSDLVSLSNWLTSPENPYFAKAIVNRLWRHTMGRGLVEPVDDFRDTNPATHPDLLDGLAQEFIENNYDLRHVFKLIVMSQAYARSSQVLEANAYDDRFYSHVSGRALAPEVMADAISDVLDLPEKYGDQTLGTRAVSLMNPKTSSRTLDVLGRCDRTESCEDNMEAAGGLPQKLHLLNGALLNARIGKTKGRLQSLIETGNKPMEIIAVFYHIALAREPMANEASFWQQKLEQCQSEEEQHRLLEDFLWALLNSKEFATNH
ncbi:MAG: DUF1553 domain-containing protein [Planctomycetota bacterium]